MQPQATRNAAWGREPVSEWTDAETKAWEKEQQTRKEALADMDERVHKAVQEFRRDPAAVSKNTEEAIRSMGVRPDKKTGSEVGGVPGYQLGISTAKNPLAGSWPCVESRLSEGRSHDPAVSALDAALAFGNNVLD
jgi:hypothetical protein